MSYEPKLVSFEGTFLQTKEDFANDESSDMLARITIDGYPDPKVSDQGQVVVTATVTRHGDVVVDWHHNGYRMNEAVLEKLEAAKSRLREVFTKTKSDGKNLDPAHPTEDDRHA